MAQTGESAAPTEASLHEAALRHLARFATTEAGLARVLNRRVDRWARASNAEAAAVAEAKRAVRAVVARLVAAGAVDDAAFAAGRARRLARGGHSRRQVAAHLAARGIAAETVREALSDDAEIELAAALVLARRRRIGPFRSGEVNADVRRRELGILARAGFSREIAVRALGTDTEAAEELVRRSRNP
jgi:regulatory protein